MKNVIKTDLGITIVQFMSHVYTAYKDSVIAAGGQEVQTRHTQGVDVSECMSQCGCTPHPCLCVACQAAYF